MRKLKILLILLAITPFFTFFDSQPASTIEASPQKNRKAKPDDRDLMTECGHLESLDRIVQERFRKTDKRLGVARMKPVTVHINYFSPETAEEKRVIQELEAGGWLVAFYLAGRRILDYESLPANSEPSLYEKNRILNGPLAMTSSSYSSPEMTELPRHYELMEHARNAIIVFARKDEYNFKIGRWNYLARPIRAQEYCLSCHNNAPPDKFDSLRVKTVSNEPERYREYARSKTPIKVGDALGVAIYAYTHAEKLTRTKQHSR
jgi:hypothetical protein